jgi:hypothetical protein
MLAAMRIAFFASPRPEPAPSRRGSFFASLLLVSTIACTSTTETTYVDAGRTCVSGAADQPHSVEVDFLVCLSSSCDEVVEAMCETTLSGTELTINATATVSSSSGACTADCGQLLATCETDPLPAGEYQLVYGDRQGTLTVPVATDEPTCLGDE